MSEKKKKVIYVKDLVIKADNVTIEPPKRRRPVDPFFGPRREEVEAVEEERHEKHDEVESVEEERDDYKDDDEGEKRPFSWI
ncbi:hypothetical protein [Radiobacillus sp. PE A8.2]|uniref:hypothetical protein n=1 Tax=Radiobacillus sp. PE A8.2 TaxID=3380349 RepID=UPI00388F889D